MSKIKTSFKRAIISIQDNNEKKYVQLKTVLGSSAVCNAVDLEEATLFDNPSKIQWTLDNFVFTNPSIEAVTVEIKVDSMISTEVEKYQLFLELSKQMEEK